MSEEVWKTTMPLCKSSPDCISHVFNMFRKYLILLISSALAW